MPLYDFRDVNTQEIFTKSMSMSAKEQYLVENPHIEQIHLGMAAVGDAARMGLLKPDANFRDRLKEIKKHHIRSTINTF